MARLMDPVVNEFKNEVAITRRCLDRVPEDKLGWKPHPKSMTLGQLAWHVATIPRGLARLLEQDSFDVTQGNFVPPQPPSAKEIREAFEESARDGEQFLLGITDDKLKASWRLMNKDRELFSKTRGEVLRTVMLNHWYHHRGQLSVYLRMLDVPVPVIYGRSADEDPFA